MRGGGGVVIYSPVGGVEEFVGTVVAAVTESGAGVAGFVAAIPVDVDGGLVALGWGFWLIALACAFEGTGTTVARTTLIPAVGVAAGSIAEPGCRNLR